MSVYCIINQTGRLSDPTKKLRLDEPLAYSNQRAHSFRFTVLAEGSDAPETLTGVGVTGQFMQQGVTPNRTVAPINGTVTGNVCEVILPASCYVVPGRYRFTMDISVSVPTTGVPAFSTTTNYSIGDEVVYQNTVWAFIESHSAGAWTGTDAMVVMENRTILWVEGIVERNSTEEIVDPGTPIPNVTAAINNANAAASAANAAATLANGAAEAAEGAAEEAIGNFAPAFAEATANAAGTYVTYTDGKMYFLPNGHTANTTWANTTKSEVKVGGELTYLKGALNDSTNDIYVLSSPIYGKNFLNNSNVKTDTYINWETGEEGTLSNYTVTDYLPVVKGVMYGFIGDSARFAFYNSFRNFAGKQTQSNNITDLSGGSGTTTTGSRTCKWFVSPINGYLRYTFGSTIPANRRIFMAIKSSADIIGTKFPAYTDNIRIEPKEAQDVEQLKDEMGDAQDSIERINDVIDYSGNLLNLEALTAGYLNVSTGDVVSTGSGAANYSTSDFIPANANDTIRFQTNYKTIRYDDENLPYSTYIEFVCAYDATRTFISNSGLTDVRKYVCPANTKYVRVTLLNTSINSGSYYDPAIIISDSSIAVPYVPYGKALGVKSRIDAYIPPDIYCAVGRTIELYNNQVCLQADEYHVQWVCQIGKALERKFSVTGDESQIGDYPLSVSVYTDDMSSLWRATATLHIVAELNLDNVFTICPIGDSLTNSKRWAPEVMNLSGNKIAFVGTYTATLNDSEGNPKSFGHEGRSGFSAANYINGSPYTFGGATETPHNKFWDGDAFSWSHYKTTYSIDPDAVMVWLGINGVSLNNTNNAGNIKDIVDIIRSDDANIPIFVCNTIYRGNQNALGNQTATDGYAANQGDWNYQEKQKVMNLMKTLDGLIGGYENVHIINLALSHDSEYNYGAVETPVNPRATQTEMMPVEATHPQAQGYYQIADIMYSVFSAVIT